MSERTHFSEAWKSEFFQLAPANPGRDVGSRHGRFPHGMLGSRRSKSATRSVWYPRCIAYRPHILCSHDLQMPVHQNSSALLSQWQTFQQQIGKGRHSRHHSAGGNPFSARQHRCVGGRCLQTLPQPQLDAPPCKIR